MSVVLDFVRRFLSKRSQEIVRLLPSESGGYLGLIDRAVQEYGYRPVRHYCRNSECSAYFSWVERARMSALRYPVRCDMCGEGMT